MDKSVRFSSLLRSAMAGKTQADLPASVCPAKICRGCRRASQHVPWRGQQGPEGTGTGTGLGRAPQRGAGCCWKGAWLRDAALTRGMHGLWPCVAGETGLSMCDQSCWPPASGDQRSVPVKVSIRSLCSHTAGILLEKPL